MIGLNEQVCEIGLREAKEVFHFNLGKEYLKQKESSLLTSHLNGQTVKRSTIMSGDVGKHEIYMICFL